MEVKLSHSLKDTASLLSMSCRIGGGDEEVIHIDNQLSFSDHVLEQVIHELLECGRGVAKAEEHDSRFKESFVGDEGRLPLVTIFDMNIVIPSMNIKLSEVASIFQLVHEIRDERKVVGIAGGVFIEVSVVLTGVEFSIFPFHKEERGHLKGI